MRHSTYMDLPCEVCERLRRRIQEAVQVEHQAVSIWEQLQPPGADSMLGTMLLNVETQRLTLEEYIQHVEATHRHLNMDRLMIR